MLILKAGLSEYGATGAKIRIRSLSGWDFIRPPLHQVFKKEVPIMKINMKNLSFLLAILSMLLLTGNAGARGSYETAWSSIYPSSTLDTTYSCDLCHNTPYYTDIKNQLGGQTNVNSSVISTAITAVEPLDSDGDSFTNIDEINHDTHPGVASSHPLTDIPAITDHSPSSPVSNFVGDERTFNISANQTVNVTWFINGSVVQSNESVTEARYTNISAASGTWNVTAFVQNKNGTDMQVWDWIVSLPQPGTPEITGYSPSSPVSNVAGDERTFNISANQTVNVTWFINGSMVQFNESVTSAKYTNKSAATGTWNITSFAENKNGTDIQIWDWVVSQPPTGSPEITGHSPSSPVSNAAGDERTFSISANQTVNVTWFINGSMVQFNESVTSAKYTNKSAAPGTWNVTALAENDYGMDMQKWDWTVSPIPPGAPKIISSYPEDILIYNNTGEPRSFGITLDNIANVSWYIYDADMKGNKVDSDNGVSESSYTNAGMSEGLWIVEAVAENAKGSVSKVWMWIVTPQVSEGNIEAGIKIKPETLNLASNGKITVSITLPREYDVANIDFDNVTCEGAHPVGEPKIAKGNTVKLKFDRQDLENLQTGKHVALTVTGEVLHDGAWLTFEGRDTIRVIDSAEEDEEDDVDDHDEEDIEEDDADDHDEEDIGEDDADDHNEVSKSDSVKEVKVKSKDRDSKKDTERDNDENVKKGNANAKDKSIKKGENGKKTGKEYRNQGNKYSEEDDD